MWKGNPALTSVLFGLPMGFFALICYSICCADIMDADEEEEDELNYSHEKTDWEKKSYKTRPAYTAKLLWDRAILS